MTTGCLSYWASDEMLTVKGVECVKRGNMGRPKRFPLLHTRCTLNGEHMLVSPTRSWR